MNHRVLELLKTPKNIQSEDLNLLKEEINSFPYVQNIRALYLYGVHLYDKENYQQVLSTTAAYTTDKKILYHLINGKIQQPPKPELQPEKEKPVSAENALKVLYKAKATGFPIKREEASVAGSGIKEEPLKEPVENQDEHGRILPSPREEIRHLYVNGARNRILFEGEENFLEDDTVETIDLESTLESGSIVTQKIEKKEESALVSEQRPLENASPETREIQETGEKEASSPQTADEEEEINAESEDKKDSDKPATALREQVFNEETESQPAEKIHSETVDDDAVKETETVSSGPVEPETDPLPSETDFHHIKAILDVLEGDSEEEPTPAAEAAPENPEKEQAEKTEESTPEIIILKENIRTESEEEKILDESALSFHETEAFMPEVQSADDEAEQIKKPENTDSANALEVAGFTPEKIIDEDEISSGKVENTVKDEAELSFHGTESFLPEVKIQANEEEPISKMPQQNLSKHEDEMRRLIEEVEKKMKEKAASDVNKKEEEPDHTEHGISFAETQSFEVKPAEPEMPEAKEKANENSDETKAEETEKAEIQTSEQPVEKSSEEQTGTRSWKPMAFDSNIPDSLLNKPAQASPPVAEVLKEKTITEEIQDESPEETEMVPEAEKNSDSENDTDDIQETVEPIGESEAATQEKTEEEERVMNVSFFGSGWTIPQSEKREAPEKNDTAAGDNGSKDPVEKPAVPKANIFDSNVPGFINTWQSWLKIDRTEEVVKEKTDLKNKVIETFIETNPRISQLKDESSFVIREKGDDISHLMTETLANLYFEQKLYTKAIKAFEILIKKTPEKKKYYEGKIQEIKDFRTKG